MALILSHKTACEYWLSPYATSDYLLRNPVGPTGALAGKSTLGLKVFSPEVFTSQGVQGLTLRRNSREASRFSGAKAVRAVLARYPDVFRKPYHCATFNRDKAWEADGLRVHSIGRALPPDSLFELGVVGSHKVFVVSPELAFVQMSEQLSLVELLRLGYRFCSQFCLVGPSELIYRVPVVDAARLQRVVSQLRRYRGRCTALKAVRYLSDGAASPREEVLSMLLCLPCSCGGYGLPVPLLNRYVAAGKYIADLSWHESKVLVEYDSNEWHTGAERIARDSKRRGNLSLAGYQVVGVTNEQIKSIDEMDVVAQLIARGMGRRFRFPRDYDYRGRQRHLRWELRQQVYAGLF